MAVGTGRGFRTFWSFARVQFLGPCKGVLSLSSQCSDLGKCGTSFCGTAKCVLLAGTGGRPLLCLLHAYSCVDGCVDHGSGSGADFGCGSRGDDAGDDVWDDGGDENGDDAGDVCCGVTGDGIGDEGRLD